MLITRPFILLWSNDVFTKIVLVSAILYTDKYGILLLIGNVPTAKPHMRRKQIGTWPRILTTSISPGVVRHLVYYQTKRIPNIGNADTPR